MTIYTNRIRRSYLMKRNKRKILIGSLLFSIIIISSGITIQSTQSSSRLISSLLWPMSCCHVVGGTLSHCPSGSLDKRSVQ